jgi:hypothetical protein
MIGENGLDKAKNQAYNQDVILVWAIFLTLFIGVFLVSFGLNLPLIGLGLAFFGLIFAYRYTYFTFYLALLLLPFLGITISISTGDLKLGTRAFGGSIDLYVGEVILLCVLGAWAIKVFRLWKKRGDVSWRPKLPILKSYAALVGAHVISLFSGYGPDLVQGLKFILRPVIFCYLAFIVLPVNLIRSRRRLKVVLGILVVVGCIAALNGLVSLGSVIAVGSLIRRAHPISLFGLNPIGDNHNVLAELLLATGPTALALGALAKKASWRRVLYGLAIVQILVGLLTFARTAWLVCLAQLAFLLVTIWRPAIKRHLSELLFLILLITPLAWFQLQVSFSSTAQSSNLTRWMLTDIAYQAFLEHPWIGNGAGTFTTRVGNARLFYQEFGDPLDAHGVIQKIMVEAGSLGVLAYILVLLQCALVARRQLRGMKGHDALAAYALVAAGGGAFAYQFLNTAYWTAHMWLPVGLMFAGLIVLKVEEQPKAEDYLAPS